MTAQPSNYVSNVVYAVKNDDGSITSSTNYSITGNQLRFTVPGSYRITATIPAASGNDASLPSQELKVQIAPNVPDDNFRAILKAFSSLHFSGEVLAVSGSTAPRTLNLFSDNISSMEGIRLMAGTDTIHCGNNKLTNLDVHNMATLVWLDCPNNQLQSLNVQGATQLTFLYCIDNKLTKLDVQGLTNLVTLDCTNNFLTALNVQGLNKLTGLGCNNNKISVLDLTGLSGLGAIDCSNNPLTSLDVTAQTKLFQLQAINDNYTTLDLRGLNELNNASCYGGPLTTLSMSTAPGSYSHMVDFRVPVTLQCSPGIKQIKQDNGSAVSLRTFNGDQVINNNFDATTCP